MQKLVLTFGIIAGVINSALWLATRPLWMDANGRMDMQSGEILGYISMIVALSMIFFGVRSYRDKHLDGFITFGRAFKVGILITLVASVIYVAGWMVYYHTTNIGQSFPAQYLDHMSEQMREKGAAQAEIEKKLASYREQMEIYKNPIVMIGVTLMEIFPVGLVISLISALILIRKP